MDCPKCDLEMSFVPANQNWWCNPCLSIAEGDAPSGLTGPTVDQMANELSSSSTSENSQSRWFGITDLLDPGLLALLFLVGGGILIYMSHPIFGGILIASVVAVGVLHD